MVKYSEEIDIRGHYTDLEGRLIMKSLCDLFNDVANVQTYALKIDVPTLNEQGLTWMLHKLHILINRMPEQGENVTLDSRWHYVCGQNYLDHHRRAGGRP